MKKSKRMKISTIHTRASQWDLKKMKTICWCRQQPRFKSAFNLLCRITILRLVSYQKKSVFLLLNPMLPDLLHPLNQRNLNHLWLRLQHLNRYGSSTSLLLNQKKIQRLTRKKTKTDMKLCSVNSQSNRRQWTFRKPRLLLSKAN
jgi:hypothetical protein